MLHTVPVAIDGKLAKEVGIGSGLLANYKRMELLAMFIIRKKVEKFGK